MTLDPKALEAARDRYIKACTTGFPVDVPAAIVGAYLSALPPVDVVDLADRVASHWDEEGITAPVPVDVAELVGASSPLDHESVMKQWDSWREYIADGGEGSWPRDAFESLLDCYDEALTRLARERDTAYATLEKLACFTQTENLLWWQIEARAALSTTKADTRAETSPIETETSSDE